MTRLRAVVRAFDPGQLRLEQAIKAGLAIITAAGGSALVLVWLQRTPVLAPINYSVIVTFVSFMLFNDVKPRARQHTLWLAAPVVVVAPFLVAAVQASTLASAVLLLAAMFASFAVRRFGQRAAELGATTVMALYFAWLVGTTQEVAPLVALGGALGIGAAYVWMFVIWPSSPQRSLIRSLHAFDRSAADAVSAIARQIAAGAAAGSETAALTHVHRSRRVIEFQVVAVTGAEVWTHERAGQLRVLLFDAEQGVEHMAASSAALAALPAPLPEPIRAAVGRALAALQAALARDGAATQMRMLTQAGAQVTAHARATGVAAATWPPALLELAGGTIQVAQALHGVRQLRNERVATQETAAPPQSAPPARAAAPHPHGLHPTTRLGLQAVVACGAAMFVAVLLNLTYPNWTFWSAYIVVAGTIGESVRKVIHRVLGTTLGAIVGTVLALVLPANGMLLITLQILALMLVLYTRVISYAWVVFWVTVVIALISSVKGLPAPLLLVGLPLTTMLGAIIAALVVWRVLPLHERGRFITAVASYLTAIDAYLAALVGSLRQAGATAAVKATAHQVAEAYDALGQTVAALALEYSPLASARSPVTSVATVVAALHAEVDRFARVVVTEGDVISADQAATIQARQHTIHATIAIVQQQPAGPPAHPITRTADGDDRDAAAARTSTDHTAVEDPRAGVRAVVQLGRIAQTISELGTALAAVAGGGV